MPYANEIASLPVLWRQRTPLHKTMGPRVIRLPLSYENETLTWRFSYGINTIDRVIGFALMLGSPGWGQVFDAVLIENNTGWNMSIFNDAVNYAFPTVYGNLDTLENELNLSFAAARNFGEIDGAKLFLYNFELPPGMIGGTFT